MSRKRVELYPGGVAVWFDPAKSGVQAFGDLRPGVEYVVAPDEAERLIAVKGFERVEPTAEPAATDTDTASGAKRRRQTEE